jgi:LacI family transcriptional regulator
VAAEQPTRETGRKRNGHSETKPSVSIHQVAAEAGVSIATVSRVMNSPELVSADTTDRVQRAIRKLDYVPNPFAHGLSKRQSRVVGIALPDIHGEFYSELLRGANAEAHRLGYHLLISSELASLESHSAGETNGDANGTDAQTPSAAVGASANAAAASAKPLVSRRISSALLDGIAVMVSEPNEAVLKHLQEAPVPVVVVDADVHHLGIDCVRADNAPGTSEAVEHLLKHVPASRCCFVGGPKDNFDARERANAFRDVLAARGHRVTDEQVSFGEYTLEWGVRWAKAAADRGTLRGAGVLAGNDEIACGIMQAAEDAGVSIPADLKLIGFDDTRLASLVRPRLTSVRVPMAEVGAGAVRALVERLENREAPAKIVQLRTSLVIRESAGT